MQYISVLGVLLFSALAAEDKLSNHTIQLKNEILSYTAVVGSMAVMDREQKEVGQISYISYIKEVGAERPITFAFNGGPGSSSIWLHMGAFGPRRIKSPEEGQSIAPPYEIVDNLETLLDTTDLVFIDPLGTGFSTRPNDATEPYFDVVEDYESIGKFIRDYLVANRRWNSPKYVAGESYGALRACGLSAYLQEGLGIYLNGLILVSSAIDYQTLTFEEDNQLPYMLFMPTYAATAWFHGRNQPELSIEEIAAGARRFTYEKYAPLLLCQSCYTEHQKEALYDQVSALTGISPQTVRRKQGKISDLTFCAEFFGDDQRVVGRMDTRSIGYYKNAWRIGFEEDPSVSSLMGSFTAAGHDYLTKELNCLGDYCILSLEANARWDYTSYNPVGYPNLMRGLRQALIVNPELKVYVGCGYFDCATPFAAAEYCIDHLNLPSHFNANIQLEYYEGGHMFYSNPSARAKLKQDLVRYDE